MEIKVKLPDYKKIASSIKKRKVELTSDEIDRLKAEKERAERDRLRQEILEKIAKDSEIELPQQLVDRETERMLGNLKQHVAQILQIDFEEYLKKINKTEKDILDALLLDAQKRVRNSLVLKKIEAEENIESTEEEIAAEFEKILSRYPESRPLDQEGLREYTKNIIKQEKIFRLLENLTQDI